MNEREKIIRLWFDMWLKQQDLGMDKIFTEDVVYTESWCPKYENLKTVKHEMIEELPDYIVECLDEFISHYGTLEEVVEHKDDIYYYPDCETMTDVAYYYIDELQALGDIPPSLQNYIDYEAYGRDLDMGGCFIETSRGMCEIPY